MLPKFELDRLLSYDDEALLAELHRVAAIIDSPCLTTSAFDELSKASSSVIRRRFGGWQQALARAGLQDRYCGPALAKRCSGRAFTDEQLLAELRAVSDKLGGAAVTTELFNKYGEMNAETVRSRFGSWWEALKRAGLEISNHGKRYSDDDYFENLLAVWTHHGRQPKYRELDRQPSRIPSGAYEKKWGTWTKALLAFLDRVSTDTREAEAGATSDAVKPTSSRASRRHPRSRRIKDEDRRQIRLGLRYQVLKRDHFRCVLCGASPATHLGCVLHVDHVIPFSKGGKTVAENLRSLCDNCNLGKSSKVEDKGG